MAEDLPRIVKTPRHRRVRDSVRRKLDLMAGISAITPRVWVTHAIVAANALMFIVMIASGVSVFGPSIEDLLKFGADYGPYTANGQWWRLITSTFVHIGVFHLLVNMVYFAWAAPVVERFFGNRAFLFIYLASGLAGSLASISLNPEIVSAGASGSIFGVFGALLAFRLRFRTRIPTFLFRPVLMMIFVPYNLLFGFIDPSIDNAAHIGGLAGGFVCGLLLYREIKPDAAPQRGRVVRAAMFGVVLLGAAPFLLMRVKDTPASFWPEFPDFVTLFEKEEYDEIIEKADQMIEALPIDAHMYNVRGWANYGKDDAKAARADFEEAIRLNPMLAYALYGLGRVDIMEGKPRDAIRNLTKAIELEPAELDFLRARVHAFNMADRFNDLVADCNRILKEDPQDSNALYQRGLGLGHQGSLAGVIRDMTMFIEREPENSSGWAWRGYAYFAKGNWIDARRDFRVAYRLDEVRRAELVLYTWVLQRRLGEGEAADRELEEVLQSRSFDEANRWIPPTGGYLLGKIPEEEWIRKIRTEELGLDEDDPDRIIGFYTGIHRLLKGDEEGAISRFQTIIDRKLYSSELWAAREEIKRL